MIISKFSLGLKYVGTCIKIFLKLFYLYNIEIKFNSNEKFIKISSNIQKDNIDKSKIIYINLIIIIQLLFFMIYKFKILLMINNYLSGYDYFV